jgi:hypothetical protein
MWLDGFRLQKGVDAGNREFLLYRSAELRQI